MREIKFRQLNAGEIDCRVNKISEKGLQLLLYKNARCDMNILDDTVGPQNWQRKHELINGNLFCQVGINVAEDGEEPDWVWKEDVGTESNTEKEKGEASDSFKRACFNWGIGRELYSAPFIWINPDCYRPDKGKNGAPGCKDNFSVSKIAYDGGKISDLEITNDYSGETVYQMKRKRRAAVKKQEKKEEQPEADKVYITKDMVESFKDEAKRTGMNLKRYMELKGIKDLSELKISEYKIAMDSMAKKPSVIKEDEKQERKLEGLPF